MTDTPKDTTTKYRLIGPSDNGEVSDLLESLSENEAKHRLQALIAEWLRMENLVVLTGAGTSVSSGGNTMVDLEKNVFETIKATKEDPSGVNKENIDKIIELRENETPKSGFEDWLSFLVNANHLGANSISPFEGVKWKGAAEPTQTDLLWFIEIVGKAIFAECALSLPDTPPGASGVKDIAPHLAFLSKLVARDSNLGRTHLFTLNYDTLFEQALELLGIQYFDGFTGRADARFDPSVYGLDIYYPGEVAEGRVRRFDKFLHLYKLHGSIHWFVRSDEMRARHPDLQAFMDYRGLEHSARAEKLGKLAKSIPSVGILPTALELISFLRLALILPYMGLTFTIRVRSRKGASDALINSYISTNCTDQFIGSCVVMKCGRVIRIFKLLWIIADWSTAQEQKS